MNHLKISCIKDLGAVIRQKRKSLELTQASAAGLCGVGIRFFSELERGKPTLSIEKVFHVTKMLGIIIEVSDKRASQKYSL